MPTNAKLPPEVDVDVSKAQELFPEAKRVTSNAQELSPEASSAEIQALFHTKADITVSQDGFEALLHTKDKAVAS